MASTAQAPVPSSAPRPSRGSGDASKGKEPLTENISLLISVLVHGFAMVMIGLSALMAPHRPSEVPVFELVNLEKPKLRPIQPKVKPPPEPPPPEPEPVRPPEAPKLTPTPTQPPQPKKPEPKVVKEKPPDEDPKPVKEVVPEQQVLENQVTVDVPQDPRLSFWASRVNAKVRRAWSPASGVEVSGDVEVVVNFTVDREGKIIEQVIAKSSGNADVDQLALMTIQRVETVPQIPENWPNETIVVGSTFIYHGQ
jgi:periplasmic protein TonB